MATTISLDALDAVELAEILEFLVECLDIQHITTLPACDRDVYNLNDLRADIARLIHRLHTCPPVTNSAAEPPEWITLNRCDVEEITHILGQLEDLVVHGDDEVIQQVTRFLTHSSPQSLATWVGELASHLRPRPTAPGDPHPGRARSTPAHEATPVTVEVDHGSASSRGQPPGHVWLVRLGHANRSIVVAVGLSRTAADHLAEHITDVIGPTTTQR